MISLSCECVFYFMVVGVTTFLFLEFGIVIFEFWVICCVFLIPFYLLFSFWVFVNFVYLFTFFFIRAYCLHSGVYIGTLIRCIVIMCDFAYGLNLFSNYAFNGVYL
jgi:hypothetical protein